MPNVFPTSYLPNITIIISAYNEEKNIQNKLDNLHSLDYPLNKITILVVSDASNDNTNILVSSYPSSSVCLIISTERRGKTHCENLALQRVQDELVLFTDASTILESSCLRNLVRHFHIEEVGCVSTRDQSVQSLSNKGENIYVRYEMGIRFMESITASLIGLSGSCYAARTVLCEQLPDHTTRDFALPLISREKGYVSIDEPEAICYVAPTEDLRRELDRKIRTFTNGMDTLFYKKKLLNVSKYGAFSLMLWSHKIFRWLLPFAYSGLLVSNLILLYTYGSFFNIIAVMQLLFYLIPSLANIVKNNKAFHTLVKVAIYIHIANLASALAWYNFIRGKQQTIWNPTVR
ncbi:MAG: glycosyltransferase [Smithellaceae bacterium]